MPPRQLRFSKGFTDTHSSAYGSVAPTTREEPIRTFVPSRDS